LNVILKLIINYNKKKNRKFLFINFNNYGDWGLGIGDWGLGVGANAPNPKPKNPNPKKIFLKKNIL